MMIAVLSLLVSSLSYATEPYTAIYNATERQLGVPIGILKAIGEIESKHQNILKHKDGKGERTAYGILQIHEVAMKQVRPKASPEQLMNPKFNIQVGGEYLVYQYKRCGSWVRALSAYNTGKCKDQSKYATKVLSKWGLNKKVLAKN
jgi:soluble lytic murein transglycosylase-like protein